MNNQLNVLEFEEEQQQYAEYKAWLNTPESKTESTSSKYPPSFGIIHWIKTLIISKEPTILNLKTKIKEEDKPKFNDTEYNTFEDYFFKVVKKVSVELNTLQGPIIESHILPINTKNTDYTKAMQEIVDKYINLYLKDLKNDGKHKITSGEEIFPNYLEDLYTQNNKPYTEFEKASGLSKPIVEQTDEEFFTTLGLRVEGLKECQTKLEGQIETAKDYFDTEFTRENFNYDKEKTKNNELEYPLLNLTTQNKTKNKTQIIQQKQAQIQTQIESQCKTIYYNGKMLEDSKVITTNIDLQKEVFSYYEKWLSQPNEIEFAKTFLPAEYFINQNTQTQDVFKSELFEKVLHKGREKEGGF